MNQKYPVAVWQDCQGAFTACVLDGPLASAADRRVSAALLQIKRYLQWLGRDAGYLAEADFHDLELRDHRVRLRPEYRVGESVYPVSRPFELRVTWVHGKRRDGSLHCVAPTLGLRLSYQAADPVDELVQEAVIRAVGKLTPQELSRELMPGAIRLEAVFVRCPPGRAYGDEANLRALSAIAEPLGERRRGQRAGGALQRDALVGDLAQRLESEDTSLLLVGEAGVGKTTVLGAAIRRLPRLGAAMARRTPHGDNNNVQDSDRNRESDPASDAERRKQRRFWLTSGARIIAGMRYLGQWEERCETAIGELSETGGMLCVENLLDLVRVGGTEAGESVAAFLRPYLERRELRLVAEATAAEVDACRRLLPGFVDLFQIVRVDEFTPAQGKELLDELLQSAARNLRLEIEAGLAGLIHRLFQRFQPYAAFPGRCASFVRHLLSDARRERWARLGQAEVYARFERESGLPQVLLRDDLPLPHAEVLDHFRREVLAQEAAAQAAATIVSQLKSGLNDPERPLGVLLFCGPTGVGKTEMAKALARFLFGACERSPPSQEFSPSLDRLVRLDMSEYVGYGAARRLFETADGDLSDFLKRIRRQPFSVILLDEIEKAAPETLDALLGVLDEGRLTDRFGRTTTFRSSAIVMTSNLGAERPSVIGFDSSAPPDFERLALETFRPEFYNRIDAVVAFRPLGRETIRRIAERELAALSRRDGLVKRRLKLTWSEEVIDILAATGFDARYGARPLQRAIERQVVAPLAALLLDDPHASHGEIYLERCDDGLRFRLGETS